MEVLLKGKIAKGGATKKDPNMNWYSVLCPGNDNSTDVVMLMSPTYLTGFDYKKFGGSRLPSLYSLTLKQIEQAFKHFDFGVLEGLTWIKGKGYELLTDCDSWKTERLRIIDVSWRKDWEYQGIVSEPF